MTKMQTMNGRSIDQAHEERLRRCAELGQVVPIDKPRIRVHYEQMAAELLAEQAA
jgi:ribosomal protein S26